MNKKVVCGVIVGISIWLYFSYGFALMTRVGLPSPKPAQEPSFLSLSSRIPEDLKLEPKVIHETDDTPLKKIILWNDMYGKYHYGFGLGREPFLRAGCRVNTCVITANRSLYSLDELDALVWHFRSDDLTLPSIRSPHTRYVFRMQESPMFLYSSLQPFNGVFNWTFTYRLDSDFPSPHGFVVNWNTPPVDVDQIVGNKTKLIAWFASNCHSASGRESLVRTLRQYVNIDIYGRCGPLKCARSHQNECYRMLERDYKFYLSFENSLCADYVTEKFFDVLRYYVVPIVWGSADYASQGPRHSFINANDFQSVESLGLYLKYLDANYTAYLEYFNWKTDQQVVTGWGSSARPWCNLCERLHSDASTKIYENLHDWFVNESFCQPSSSQNIARFVHGARIVQDL